MAIKDEIEARLRAAFRVTALEVVNESHRHAGHSGDDGTGESHFAVMLRAAELAPMGRLARHRAVQAALGDIHQRLHALALDLG
jgi:BolA protein